MEKEMDRQKAIELLKQKSKEAVYIASLPYRNSEYIPWRRNIEDILESAFGLKSTEYERVANSKMGAIKGTKAELQRCYVDVIQRIQQEVNSIIQKYEILGKESKSLLRNLNRRERKFTAQLPLHLYDELHLHPKVVEASRKLFKDGHYTDAIYRAFVELNNFVKSKSGLNEDGRTLMSKVFRKENPIIKLNELNTQTDIDEQEGFTFLFMGAMAGIRNPKAHENIIQSDPYKTLEYLALASLLMRRAEEGTL